MEENRESETKIEIFYDGTNWLTQQISTGFLKGHVLEVVRDRLDSLFPMAEDYEISLKECKLGLLPHEVIQQLETAVFKLWNTTEIVIKVEKNEKIRETLCYSRLFACILLSVHERLMPSIERKLRVIHCSINLLKVVVDHEWAQLLQRTNDHLKRNLKLMQETVNSFNESDQMKFKKLKLQFQVLNFQRALKQGDIKLAKHFETEANIIGNRTILDSDSLLDICRMIYNAVLMLRQRSFPDTGPAIRFLQCAWKYLGLDVPSLKSHIDYDNLRYSLLLLLIDSQIEQDIEHCDQPKCEYWIKILQKEHPEKLESYSLEIALYRKMGNSDASQLIKGIIMRMINSVNILLNIDACIGIIKDFSNLDSGCAFECLDYIFINKCHPKKDHKWLEKLLISRFFLTTQSKHLNSAKIIQNLEEFCNKAEQKLTDVLSKYTVSSIITLLWNSGKKSEKNQEYVESIGFYKLALKKFISQAYADKGKIQRALMSIYVQIKEFHKCEELFEKMAPDDKRSPLTQLIILRIFIFKEDEKSCLECLKRIKESEHDNAIEILILAVAECKCSEQLAVKAITVFFDAMESNQVTEQKLVQWSASILCLLRSTSQLIMRLVENEQPEVFTHYLSTIQKLLEKALEYLSRIRTAKMFNETGGLSSKYKERTSVDEIEWFASTSYNLALKCFAENIDDTNGIDFAQLSRSFIQLIPHQELTFPKMFHYMYWGFRSHLLRLTITQATKCKYDPSAYQGVQIEAYTLATEISQRRNDHDFNRRCGSQENEKICACLSDALSLAFEASLKLQDQIKISEILKMTSQWKDPQIETLLADFAISIYELPRSLFMETIEQLIQRNVDNHLIEDFKICQWMRNFLDCALTLGKTSQLDITKRLLQRLKKSLTTINVPNIDLLKQEIEMIATLSWNQGVHCIIKEEKSLGMRWCHISIQFASLYSIQFEAHLKELWNSLASSAQLISD